MKHLEFLGLPVEKEGYSSNYQSYSITLGESCPVSRDDLMEKLLDKEISTRRGIMLAHKEPAYQSDYLDVKLAVSEQISENSILLPLYVGMKDEEITYVVEEVVQVLNA